MRGKIAVRALACRKADISAQLNQASNRPGEPDPGGCNSMAGIGAIYAVESERSVLHVEKVAGYTA
jgi:hypothetical protein